jgi:DNA-binding IclR family transcriptional regulator
MAVGPIERAVDLLTRVAERPGETTVAELASDAGLPTSTAYRLLSALGRHGLVLRDAGTVSLGTRVVALGRAAEARLQEQLVAPATPVMERLAREQGETVILTAPCGLEAIVLHTVEAEQPIRLTSAAFGRAPMHRGASGKILAAHLDRHDRARLLDAAADPELGAALDAIRRRGWVATTGELDEGVCATAAAVLDARGRLVAGVSLAALSDRMAQKGVDRVAAAVCAAAREIEAALWGAGAAGAALRRRPVSAGAAVRRRPVSPR